MESKTLVSAKSEYQKALNIFVEKGDLLDRSFPSSGSDTNSDLKISLYLVGLAPVSPILFQLQGYADNSVKVWTEPLLRLLNLTQAYDALTMYNMYNKQAVSMHRVMYVNDLMQASYYINTVSPLLNN